jgi:hypothetical protein
MSTSTPRRRASVEGADNTPQPTPKRINVAVNQETVKALEEVIEREGVTLTEAVRRLVGYGDYVYKAVKEQGAEVLMREKNGTTRELVIL